MKKPSNSLVINIFTNLLILLIIAKFISLALLWYLPSDGVEMKTQKTYQVTYQKISFKNMLQVRKEQNHSNNGGGGSSQSINDMLLKGLYGAKDDGFIIIAMKKQPNKTSIIEVGEEYRGYKLIQINANYVMFSKNASKYRLGFKKTKADTLAEDEKSEEESDEPKTISRKDINNYIKHPEQVWKEISIKVQNKGNKVEGYKVTRINKDSKISALGLKKGDLIIKANNIRLDSLAKVLKMYNDIKNLNLIHLVVIRDNQEQELVYEIN